MPSATNGTATKISFDTFQNVIDGKLVTPAKTRHGINPATKKALPEVPVATQQDVDTAVKAGKKAFLTWSRTPVEERREAILKFAEAFKEHTNEFANMLTKEQGKPVSGARRLLSDNWTPNVRH
jgi:acyl-CoA reductase-like NAD-dependent aldehyde dehydrogenase